MFINKMKGTMYIQVIDHHNYTIETVACRNMSKADVAKMVKAFRFFENAYDHPSIDAYDDYSKPTITNADCQVFYFGTNSQVYEYKGHNGKGKQKGWEHLTTSMDAHPLNQNYKLYKQI